MIHAQTGRFPAGTWLLYQRSDGLKAAAVVRQEEHHNEHFQAVMILEGVPDQDAVQVCDQLGLPPFSEWQPASPVHTRVFFGINSADSTPPMSSGEQE